MKKVKAQAFEYYKRWRKEKTYCPALKSYIIISLKGWKHITGATGSRKRSLMPKKLSKSQPQFKIFAKRKKPRKAS